mmetsp:Transcript_118913/g.265431  ORF Transcript_118913/g.265431 Transcript_118913/m.265431 type:complete len:670 (+) Transcript_118913:150-2159(+)
MDSMEDHMNTIRTEWQAVKEKWFHGETMDPVFEGVVRDFCNFDETMQNVYHKVGVFMRGVETLSTGMLALSEGVTSGLTHANDSLIASDSCKMKEATNQIARVDAPHSAIAKLRRDMQFNILTPVQSHIANNRNLKVSLDIRRRRLIELNSAKKQFEEVQKRRLSHTDRRFLQAQSNFESAKMTFNDVDRHIFEWLYILEEYRGDILDSTLQTLKYLEYEFFATSAHAISSMLPNRMEFRPMVEMTPEHLEAQVDMELQESEDGGSAVQAATGAEAPIADFSARLIDKKAKEAPEDESGPSLPVDPLSLSSLLSQGFEEGPARRALRLHQNDTQAALDWLIDGQGEESEKRKKLEEGVRMPTTVKRVQKLKAMRRAQAEKLKEKNGESASAEGAPTSPASASGDNTAASGEASNGKSSREQAPKADGQAQPQPPARAAPPQDMLGDLLGGTPATSAEAKSAAAPADLLSLNDDAPAVPTDFSKPVEFTTLPEQRSFDLTRCEKPPLAAAVAAGIAQPRSGSGAASLDLSTVGFGEAAPAAPSAAALSGIPPELLTTVQALAAQSQVSPEQLVLAAQQLAGQSPQAAPGQQAPAMMQPSPCGGGYPSGVGSPSNRVAGAPAAGGLAPGAGAFQALDPLGGSLAASPAPAAAAAPRPGDDPFGDLGLAAPP